LFWPKPIPDELRDGVEAFAVEEWAVEGGFEYQ